jgi:predicted nucleic acid-binding protein
MKRVFVDTVAWIALANQRDGLHEAAHQVMNGLREQRAALVTTDFVLLEVADALSAPTIRAQTVGFVGNLLQLPESVLKIVPASRSCLLEGWILYQQRLDKDWGLTDCISFAVMTHEDLTVAFTSDRHFEQAGFVRLL